jgi:hypothetical protein
MNLAISFSIILAELATFTYVMTSHTPYGIPIVAALLAVHYTTVHFYHQSLGYKQWVASQSKSTETVTA